MSTVQAKLQAASTDFQKLQLDLANAVEARRKLEAQLSENELVKKVPQMLHGRVLGH
jgi:prefoldin beta subunit